MVDDGIDEILIGYVLSVFVICQQHCYCLRFSFCVILLL